MSHWQPALFWYSRALTTSRTSVGAQPGLGVGAGMMSRINSHWALVRSVLYAFRMAAGLPFRGSGILPLPNSLRPNQTPDSLSVERQAKALVTLPDTRYQPRPDATGVLLVPLQFLLERPVLQRGPHHEEGGRDDAGGQRPVRPERQREAEEEEERPQAERVAHDGVGAGRDH